MSLVILTTRKTVGPFEIKERKPKLPGLTKYVVFKGEEGLKDFGRYSAAIRWCKQQCPREVPHVVLIDGDQSKRQSRSLFVVSNVPVRYTFLDGPYHITGDALVDPEQVEEFTKPK